jgi:hypothetical protein
MTPSRFTATDADAPKPATWQDELWKAIEQRAGTTSGAEVVRLLRQTSEEVWGAGIDERFMRLCQENTTPQAFSAAAEAFDIGWLTVFLIHLSRHEVRKA